MKVVSIYNIKGGVGKTASAVNFAYLASKSGFKTLVWDLDPQGATSFYFQKETSTNLHLKKIIKLKTSIEDSIEKTNYLNLFLIPSSFTFRKIDTLLDDVKKSKKQLNEILKNFKKDYDIILLDCPPGLTLLSENIFHASDYLITPLIPTPLSVRSYDQIISYFIDHEIDFSIIIPFLSMVEIRRKLHKEMVADILKTMPNICLNTIPYLSEVEKMGLFFKPVVEFSPSSKASVAFQLLWDEIKSKIFDKI